MKKLLLILLIVLSILPFSAIQAQEEPVTAEVLYDYVHLRLGPSRHDESIAVLSQGTIGIIHAWTRYRPNPRHYIWVNITVQENGLTGWIRSDLLLFSAANWIERIPFMDALEVGNQMVAYNDPSTLETFAYNNGSPTKVYSSPLHTEIPVAEIPSRAFIYIIGRTGIGGYQRFVYVQQIDGTIEGWVNVDDILCCYGIELPPSFFEALPILVQPIQAQGQVFASSIGGENLYSEPSFEATTIARPTYNDILIVHGRTSHENAAWVYVTILETGQMGWMYDGVTGYRRGRYIQYPRGFDYRLLPILPAVPNPPLAPSVEPLQNLVTVTTFDTFAYISPYVRRIVESIPAGTSLVLTGRILNSSYFQTTYNGETVWVKFEHLQFQEGFNRLPLIY